GGAQREDAEHRRVPQQVLRAPRGVRPIAVLVVEKRRDQRGDHDREQQPPLMAMKHAHAGYEPVSLYFFSQSRNALSWRNSVFLPNISALSGDFSSGTTTFNPVSYRSPPGEPRLGRISLTVLSSFVARAFIKRTP